MKEATSHYSNATLREVPLARSANRCISIHNFNKGNGVAVCSEQKGGTAEGADRAEFCGSAALGPAFDSQFSSATTAKSAVFLRRVSTGGLAGSSAAGLFYL
jgi:hypothetical protein